MHIYWKNNPAKFHPDTILKANCIAKIVVAEKASLLRTTHWQLSVCTVPAGLCSVYSTKLQLH